MIESFRTPNNNVRPAKRVAVVGVLALSLIVAGCLGGGGDTTTGSAAMPTTGDTTSEMTSTGGPATTGGTTNGTTAGATTNGSENTTLGITVQNGSGAPVSNATVKISEENGGVLEGIFGSDVENPGAVGPNGQVSVELQNGNYTVEATADGYVPGIENVSINGTDTNITLSMNQTAQLTPTTGTSSGSPTPTLPGNQTRVTRTAGVNGTPVGVESEYPVNVTVEDASGNPVANASVEVSDQGGLLSGLFGENEDAGSVNSHGEVSVELSNGSYTISASADRFSDADTDIQINGSATNVTLALNRTTTTG